MNARATYLALAAVLAGPALPAPARAQPVGDPVPAPAPVPSSEPPLSPRLFHVPTAWLQPPGHGFASAGANHRGGGFFALATALGRLAEIDIELTDRFVTCTAQCPEVEREVGHAWLVSALFKVGLPERRLAPWQPAVALGFRRSLLGRKAGATAGVSDSTEAAELYAATSIRLGTAHLHLGAELWDAKLDDFRVLESDLTRRLRPFVGFGWRPPQYPRTTVMGDLGWVPELHTDPEWRQLHWIAGWGVRYQAFRWGSIELAVRHREADDLGGATVFVRVNAAGRLLGLLGAGG